MGPGCRQGSTAPHLQRRQPQRLKFDESISVGRSEDDEESSDPTEASLANKYLRDGQAAR